MRSLAALVAFVAAQALAQEAPRFTVRGFAIEGELPISAEDAQRELTRFTGSAVSLDELRAAATALETLLAARGYAFYRVVLPPQTIGESVTLRALPFRLARVQVEGNREFSTANILASLPELKPGESPNVPAVARNRAQANEHPSKQVEVTFRQSTQPDAVDADVKVQDASPRRLYASLQNNGDDTTGEWRLSVGGQYSNLFDRDHAISASYTTSPDHPKDVQQYGAYYSAPFYSVGGSLTGFAVYSDVDSGTVANAFQVSGRGRFAGLRWKQYLVPMGAYSHALEAGAEDRLFDNDTVFGGTQLATDVRSRPLSLGYQARWDMTGAVAHGSLTYVRNLEGGSNGDAAAYAANRAGADPKWSAWRFALEGQWAIGDWLLGGRLTGQSADEPLIPGEQFGIGGAHSVRGLQEREATGDSGNQFSAELSTGLPVTGLRGAVFGDTGMVKLVGAPGVPGSRQYASSIGFGLRWSVERRLSAVLDVAHVLDGAGVTESGHNHGHLAVVYQF